MNYVKLKGISLKNHPLVNEKWLQDVIANDPSILGIGDVIIKDKERIQTNAGRLDLLLQDADGYGRYEVELQLGATDESHLIRTIEYWDIERKKYPQYEHTAVIIAENITSRFLNVISLFNGYIPLMAIQVSAIETAEGIGLQFIKVLDTIKLGFLDEDEEISEPTDRTYWETIKGTKDTVKMADEVLQICKKFENSTQLSFNKHYIGFWVNGRAYNFAILRPQKNYLRLELHLPKTEENDSLFNQSNLDVLDYDSRWKKYRIRLNANDLNTHKEFIETLLEQSFQNFKN